ECRCTSQSVVGCKRRPESGALERVVQSVWCGVHLRPISASAVAPTRNAPVARLARRPGTTLRDGSFGDEGRPYTFGSSSNSEKLCTVPPAALSAVIAPYGHDGTQYWQPLQISCWMTTVPNSVRVIAPVGHASRQPAFSQCLQMSLRKSQRGSPPRSPVRGV